MPKENKLNLKNKHVRRHGSINFCFKNVSSNVFVSRRKTIVALSILVLLEISTKFLPLRKTSII